MATFSRISRLTMLSVACIFACANSFAQTTLLNQLNTLAASTQAVPVQETFAIATAGTYTVTLTDLGALLTPSAPLASVALAVTNGSSIVGTTLTAAGSTTFTASAAGNYTVQVVGSPGTVIGSGPIGIQIASSSGTQVASFSATLALPSTSTSTSNVGVLNDSFTVTSSGNYQVTLSDLQLPQALSTLTMAIANEGGVLVTNSTLATSSGTTTVSATVALQAGVTYRIFAGGQANTTTNAGLFGVSVTAQGSSTPVYSSTTPVGAVTYISSPALTAGSYTLSIADLAYPSALTALGGAVTLNGQSAAVLSAAGTQTFTAAANTYQVFAFGLASSSSEGSYALSLTPAGGAAQLSVARAVAASGGSTYTYSYDTTTVGGSVYSLSLADFSFPAQFTSLSVVAMQNGAPLGSALLAANSPASLTPTTGTVSLLVFAQPTSSGGLFGLSLTAGGSSTATFATTQGVGPLFSTSPVTITTSGSYELSLTDLAFPTPFASIGAIVTSGTSVVGETVSSGSITFNAPAGDYFVSFIAEPQGTYQAGTYLLTFGTPAAAPTLTLTASPTSVTADGTSTLTWSSTNVTSCTASGGWTGSEPVSGTATTSPIVSDTTFTLTCAGPGGNVSQSVTVDVTATTTPTTKSSSGGGVISLELLAFLFGVILLRASARGSG